jgi:hypothetical protein
MLKQTIVWTALPHRSNGAIAAGTKLRLSAFVAPRLWTDDATITKLQLSDFPDFRDWPKTLAGATFQVVFDGGPALPATVIAPPPLPPGTDLWNALFKDDTLVIPFAFEDLTGAEYLTFSSTTLHGEIKKIYQDAATDPAYGLGVDLPHRSTLAKNPRIKAAARPRNPPTRYVPESSAATPAFVGTPGPEDPGIVNPVPTPGGKGCRAGCMGCLAAPWLLLRRLLKYLGLLAALPFTMSGIGGGLSGSASSDSAPGSPGSSSLFKIELDKLQKYVEPTSETSAPLPTVEQLQNTYDFHQMVSSLGDYPNLLRHFGLVVDLEVTLDATLPAPAGMVSVIPTLPLATTTTNYSPRTHYELGAGMFLTQSRPDSDLSAGLLRVDDTNRFNVLQLDIPGSGIKMQSAATALVSQEELDLWPANEPENQGLPYLQTAGISIVRPDLALDLKASFFRAWALNKKLAAIDFSPTTAPAGPDPAPVPTDEIWAEDALRGYRVDVFDNQSNRWHSLCRRVGTYIFDEHPGGSLTLKEQEDEGFVQMAVTEPLIPTEGNRQLRLHESLFTWNGWSLAAPRYGKTILTTPGDVTEIGEPKNAPATQFKLETKFVPKKQSLPRLRFGYRYKLRARAVDLAGNSVFNPDDPAFADTQTEVTPEETYRRFEPVAPPMVMLQAVPVEGESLERLVVRSRFDNKPAPAIDKPTTVRHLVPPKTSQVMAEQHRKFDGDPAMKSDLTAYKLAAREAGSTVEIVDPLSGARSPIPGVVEVKAPLPPDSDPANPPPPPHTYWLQTKDAFELAYLPDPYARGVTLTNLPGAPHLKIAFEGAWPDAKPFRVRVNGIAANTAPAPPQWIASAPADPSKSGVLTVEVPQGETFEVRISSWFELADLDNMAIWGWTQETGVPGLNDLRDQTLDGRNWLQVPFRTLVLVHAVQQPLLIPDIETVAADKALIGDTVAVLSGQVRVDAKSTEKIDLQATWVDPIDIPGPTPPGIVAQTMQVAELRVDAASDLVSLAGVRHAFGDTKHHHVHYSPTGSTRFREYFPATITADPKTLIRPATGETATTLDTHVKSSARPDAPRPLYVLPLFHWERTTSGLNFHSAKRTSAGLRVYMDRPWHSSGEGELLGVALRPPAVPIGAPEAEALKKYTSEWGMDPLWSSAEILPLAMSDFTDTVDSKQNVPLAELENINGVVDIVAYRPEFDPERNLWYCDILLDPKTTYFPMVRLALVRFQPHSLEGVHISNVVLTDFVQVVPHRTVTYDTAATPDHIRIIVQGPSHANAPQMIVRLEEPSDVGSGDELGWQPFATHALPVVTPIPEITVWMADIPTAGHPSPIRVVVFEVEIYRVDEPMRTNLLQLLGQDQLGPADASTDYRVTFADTLEI